MCGIVGVIGAPSASKEAFLGLTTLQHRGQDAAGILTFDHDGFHQVRDIGLVESVFQREHMDLLTGSLAIAHTRYSTIGRGDRNEVQPFVLTYPFGLGMAHNGNLVNSKELGEQLKRQSHRHLLTQSDTEVLLNLLAQGLSETHLPRKEGLDFEDLCQAVQQVFDQAKGSFSVVTLVGDHGLLAFRDPQGNRPLIWGKRKVQEDEVRSPLDQTLPSLDAHMVTSESVALYINDYDVVRDLEPGELLYIDFTGKVHHRVLQKTIPAHCMFEWVYFASPESVMDQIPVYGTRLQLGRAVAEKVKRGLEEKGISVDMVVPVPESSRIAAIALAEELGLPYREVLIKNRYIKRTFILDSQDKRQKAVKLKLSPVLSEIQGKTILLVDDSIVRGTTSKKLVSHLRNAGAAKVIFVSTCPPIQHPCYYGIDIPDENELIAFGRDHEEVRKLLGADALIYQDIEGLRKAMVQARMQTQQEALGSGANGDQLSLCMACLNGKYPIDISSGFSFAESRRHQRTKT
jgi:amidophosphoribosyltransferase